MNTTYKSLLTKICMSIGIMEAFLLTGCINDVIGICPEDQENVLSGSSDITLNLKVYLPTTATTRSTTTPNGGSSDVTMDAETNENIVNRAMLYFYEDNDYEFTGEYDVKDNFIFMFSAYKVSGPGSNNTYTLKTQVNLQDIKKLVGKHLKLYIGGNFTSHKFSDTEYLEPVSATFSMGESIESEPLGMFGVEEGGKILPLANQNYYKIDFTNYVLEDDVENPGHKKVPTDQEIIEWLASLIGNGYNATERALSISDMKKNDSDETHGTVDLERCVARIDYKPTSGVDQKNKNLPENVYQVGQIENLFAKITSMQVFNIKKNSFLFRHTASGIKTEASYNSTSSKKYDFKIFGVENDNIFLDYPEDDQEEYPDGYNQGDNLKYRWIYDNDWENKRSSYLLGMSSDYFLNMPTKGPTDPVYYLHPEFDGWYPGLITLDNLKFNNHGKTIEGYYPWCYVAENTLPSISTMTKGLTTGIAFNMLLTKQDGITPLTLDNFMTQAVYAVKKQEYFQEYQIWYDDLLNWLNDNPSKTAQDYEIPSPKDPTDGYVVVTEPPVKYNGSDFYLLKIGNQECYAKAIGYSDGKPTGFELVYYYYIRHNISRNHQVGNVEPMQFAVVRNNVYQISVTALNSLPVPFVPTEPAEPQKLYITVDLKILSWAKHDIEVGF